jgi:hypothetical protein
MICFRRRRLRLTQHPAAWYWNLYQSRSCQSSFGMDRKDCRRSLRMVRRPLPLFVRFSIEIRSLSGTLTSTSWEDTCFSWITIGLEIKSVSSVRRSCDPPVEPSQRKLNNLIAALPHLRNRFLSWRLHRTRSRGASFQGELSFRGPNPEAQSRTQAHNSPYYLRRTKIGLLPRDNIEQVPFAYSLYKRTDKAGIALAIEYKQTFCTAVTIDFLGVWSVTRCIIFAAIGR